MDEMRRAQRWQEVFTAIAWGPVVCFFALLGLGFRAYSSTSTPLAVADAVINVMAISFVVSFVGLPIGLVGWAYWTRRLNMVASWAFLEEGLDVLEFRSVVRMGLLRAQVYANGQVLVSRWLIPAYVRWMTNSALGASLVSMLWSPVRLGSLRPLPVIILGLVIVFPWLLVNWRTTTSLRRIGDGIVVSVRDGPWSFGPVRWRPTTFGLSWRAGVVDRVVRLADGEHREDIAKVAMGDYGLWQGRVLTVWLGRALGVKLWS